MKKQWTADIEVTEQLVVALLKEQFPALRPIMVESFSEGWDNALFLVNETYIFRFPRRAIAVELLDMENRLLPQLGQHLPTPIPCPCFFGQPTSAYPFPFSGYRKLEGCVPQKMPLTDETRCKSAVLWGQFLRALHSFSREDALCWGIAPTDGIGRMDVDKRKPMLLEKVEEARQKGLIDNAIVLPLLAALEGLPSTADVLLQAQNAVVHGDLNFRNFLLSGEGSLCAVLDWGDAHMGHPAVDLSVLYSFLPPQSRADFFKAYGEADAQTLHLAKFRALYTNVLILVYADDIRDEDQVAEAKRALTLALI